MMDVAALAVAQMRAAVAAAEAWVVYCRVDAARVRVGRGGGGVAFEAWAACQQARREWAAATRVAVVADRAYRAACDAVWASAQAGGPAGQQEGLFE